jgi:hypothetical protein
MKVVDWRELKAGDAFRIAKPERWFTNQIWYSAPSFTKKWLQVSTTGNKVGMYPFKGGEGVVIDHGYALRVNGFDKQPVEVAEEGDISPTEALNNLTSRVGSQTGTDPEIFVMSGGLRPKLIPAWKFLPESGPKAMADVNLREGDDYCEVAQARAYKDGFAAEFYVQPATCHGYMIDYIRSGLRRVLAAAKRVDDGAQLTIRNTFKIGAKTMASGKDDEVALGCMPSLNVYNDGREQPADPRAFNLRFTGGHVHLDLINKKHREAVVKSCDLFAGVAGVALFQNQDTPLRRQFYGRAGEYRETKFGVEYRVLSNAWLMDPRIAHLTLNLVRAGAKIGYNNLTHVFETPEEAVKDVINFCDVKAAKAFVTKNVDIYLTLLHNDGNICNTPAGKIKFLKAINEGAEAVIGGSLDIHKNWKLTGSWGRHSNADSGTWVGLVAGRSMEN